MPTRIVHPRIRHLSPGEKWDDPLTEALCERLTARGKPCLNAANHMILAFDRTDAFKVCFTHGWTLLTHDSGLREGVAPRRELFWLS
jgi:hypothetical protein